MPAEYYHFTNAARCEQGATFSRVFTLCSNLTEAEKYAISTGTVTTAQQSSIDSKTRNLTGYTARMHVRTAIDAASATITLTTENGGITLGGTAGTVTITITATATAAVTAATYYYDLELIAAAGSVERLFQGRFEVDPEVTR